MAIIFNVGDSSASPIFVRRNISVKDEKRNLWLVWFCLYFLTMKIFQLQFGSMGMVCYVVAYELNIGSNLKLQWNITSY